MLNGIDPIIIFNFKSTPPAVTPPSITATTNKIPVASSVPWITLPTIDLPAIPIYLSEKLTGIYIESEDKSVEVGTTTNTLSTGATPEISQRAIDSNVKINMVASRDSIGVSLFASMVDLIYPKLTSKEYSVTYLHGAVTVFQGLLGSFSITQNSNNDLYNITLELVKPSPITKLLEIFVPKSTGTVPL